MYNVVAIYLVIYNSLNYIFTYLYKYERDMSMSD